MLQSLRRLRSRPLASLLIVALVGVGVSAAESALAPTWAAKWAPPPFVRPRELLLALVPGGRWPADRITGAEFQRLRAGEGRLLSGAGYFGPPDRGDLWVVGGRALTLESQPASPGLFRTLGVALVGGVTRAACKVRCVVVSRRFAAARFGSSRSALGHWVAPADRPRERWRVAAVLPRNFDQAADTFGGSADIWEVSTEPCARCLVSMVGRLAPRAPVRAADAALAATAARLVGSRAPGGPAARWVRLQSWQPGRAGLLAALPALWCLAGVIVLGVGASILALFAAEAHRRSVQTEIHIALGATPRKLAVRHAREIAPLAVAAGVAAWLASLAALAALERSDALPRQVHMSLVRLAPTAATPTAAAALIAAGAAALILLDWLGQAIGRPRIAAKRTAPVAANWHAAVVVGQGATATALLVLAMLFWRALSNYLHVSPGLRPSNTFSLRVTLPDSVDVDAVPGRASPAASFFAAVNRRLGGLPGVAAVGESDQPPLRAFRALPVGAPLAAFWYSRVTGIGGAYWQALGVRVLAGRRFDLRDHPGPATVAIVNSSAARALFPRESPIGGRIHLPVCRTDVGCRVVGEVADIRSRDLWAPPTPQIYLPMQQVASLDMTVVVRFLGPVPAARAADILREAVMRVPPPQGATPAGFAVGEPVALRLQLARLRQPARARLWAAAVFGGLALLAALSGIYGVTREICAARQAEFGVRLALGASPAQAGWEALRRPLTWAAVGVGAGTVIAQLLGRALAAVLYGVRPSTPTALAVAAAAVLVGAAAAALPAGVAAARACPADVLRHGA